MSHACGLAFPSGSTVKRPCGNMTFDVEIDLKPKQTNKQINTLKPCVNIMQIHFFLVLDAFLSINQQTEAAEETYVVLNIPSCQVKT